jgi:hypothetical protein
MALNVVRTDLPDGSSSWSAELLVWATDDPVIVADPDFAITGDYFHDDTGTGIRFTDHTGRILSAVTFPT